MTALKQAIGAINRDIENRKVALHSGRHEASSEQISGEIAGLKLAIERLRDAADAETKLRNADAAAARLVVELYRVRDWDGSPVGDAVDALGAILRPKTEGGR